MANKSSAGGQISKGIRQHMFSTIGKSFDADREMLVSYKSAKDSGSWKIRKQKVGTTEIVHLNQNDLAVRQKSDVDFHTHVEGVPLSSTRDLLWNSTHTRHAVVGGYSTVEKNPMIVDLQGQKAVAVSNIDFERKYGYNDTPNYYALRVKGNKPLSDEEEKAVIDSPKTKSLESTGHFTNLGKDTRGEKQTGYKIKTYYDDMAITEQVGTDEQGNPIERTVTGKEAEDKYVNEMKADMYLKDKDKLPADREVPSNRVEEVRHFMIENFPKYKQQQEDIASGDLNALNERELMVHQVIHGN